MPSKRKACAIAGAASLGPCKKCKKDVLEGQQGKASGRSKDIVHHRCMRAYKKRCRMNRQAHHKAAWDKMSEAEKDEWFAENAVAEESDDNDDDKDMTIAEINQELFNKKARKEAIPFSVFEERGLMKGWDADKILREWRSALMDKSNSTMKYGDQTLLVQFTGLLLDDVSVSGTQAALSIKKKIDSKESLDKSREEAKSILDDARAKTKAHHDSIISTPQKKVELPDELLPNRIEVADLQMSPDPKSSLAAMVEDAFAESDRREALLTSLYQKDMVAAAMFMTDEPQADDTPETLSRMKLLKQPEIGKARDVFGLLIADAKLQAKEMMASAEQKFGADDATANEAFSQLHGYDATLDTILTEAHAEISQLETRMRDAKSSATIEVILVELKTLKANKLKAMTTIRRATATLKACIRKYENKKLKGLKKADKAAGDSPVDGTLHAGHPVIKYFVNVVMKEGQAFNMTQNDNEVVDRMKPQFFCRDELKEIVKEINWLRQLVTWLKSQMDGVASVNAPITKNSHMQPIMDFLETKICDTVDQLFEKPHSVVFQGLQEIFAWTIQSVTADFVQVGLLPYALGHWFLFLEGSMLIMATKTDHVPGDTFEAKVTSFSDGKAEDIHANCKANGFCIKGELGKLVFVPSGYFLVLVALEPCVFFKWSSMAAAPNSEPQVLRSVLGGSTMMTAAFPSLLESTQFSIGYTSWMEYLEQQAKS